MQILLLSDIHANLEALEAALAVVPAYDVAYNLGDIVGYGADPNATTRKSAEIGKLFVRGNHDRACTGLIDLDSFNPIAALAAYWTQQQLTPDNLAWLRELPKGPIPAPGLASIECVHGSPLDEDEYIVLMRDAQEPLIETRAAVTFFGHTHIQGGFSVEADRYETLRPKYSTRDEAETSVLALKRGSKYLLNPGSIGQPRDGDWRAAFAVFDSDAYTLTFHRVPYDVKKTQEKILAANLPERLATRLSEGR